MPAKREALPPKPARARDDAGSRKAGRARAQAEAAPPPPDADSLGADLRADTIRYLGEDTHPRAAPPSEVRARSYQGRGEIGRGGMGVVHRVHDERLHREVAMKILASPLARDPARVQSFVEEARIAGQLEHPHIVPVHELGEDDRGQPYFTMKLVRGRSLLEWLADPARCPGSPDRLQDGLEVFLKACDAIQFAHSHGVIHRDLKPGNVMVGDFGEVYVMDWGVARLTRGGRSNSGPVAAGTPRYMAPEQARAAVEEQDERTDVFGLGAVLYEIVTGQPPYPRRLEGEALLAAARRGDYTPPEEALPGGTMSAPILRIIRKALARERADRHASVADLKAEVQRFLRGGLHLPRQDFAPGTHIVTEGEAGEAAFIIVRGSCVAYRTAGGQRHVLRRMGPGDVFGEMAVLSRLPRTATVEAVDEVSALVLTRSVLDEGLGADSWVGSLVRALAERFRELDQRLRS